MDIGDLPLRYAILVFRRRLPPAQCLDGNAEGFGETRFQFFSNAWRDGATIDEAQGNRIFSPERAIGPQQ